MVSQRKRFVLKTAAFLTLIVLCGTMLFIAFWFKAALGQSEPVSTMSIIFAAAKLEKTGADIVPISAGAWLKRTYKGNVFQFNGDALDKLMAGQGWNHSDQEGSERIYVRGKSKIGVVCQMYSIRYQVCVVHKLY